MKHFTFSKPRLGFLLLPFLAILLHSCETETVDSTLDQQIAELGLSGLPSVAHPLTNPSSSAKIALGRLLFWDPIISGHKDVACATCHHPDFGYSDGLDLPIGVNGSGLGPSRTENTGGLQLSEPIGRVPRNSPSVLNTAYNGMTAAGNYAPESAPMFWDSRMLSLESQCQGPPGSRSEMRGDGCPEGIVFDTIIARLAANAQYAAAFNVAFPGGDAVTRINYSKAIAAFERTIVTNNSAYDRYLRGDQKALSDQQKKGLLLFFGKAECNNCHSGPMLSDFNFHAMGVPDNPKHPEGTDRGKDNLYKFRTPTLRNLGVTGPYLHNGMLSTIREVVEFMNDGVSQNGYVLSGMMDPDMKPLGLTSEEMDDIVAFLESLTDTNFDRTVPGGVPSGLPVGGNIH
ncbi:MAG: c-type cytochrome [Flavobacteriales bacterium]|nr:c-type cytochrome [Flavobacteriales bacterium]